MLGKDAKQGKGKCGDGDSRAVAALKVSSVKEEGKLTI